MASKLQATILVVDDNISTLKSLFQVLREANYRVLTAEDGPGAFDRLERTRPDLILLDISMPDMDDFELYKQLRTIPQLSDTPVIFLSEVTETAQKVKGVKLHAVDYITKPFHPEEVLARIEKNLLLHRLRKELKEKNAQLEREIAERVRTEESLRESEKRYRSLAEFSPEAMAVHSNGKFVYINRVCFI